jgi:peptidoglycan/xylan/chitin deacetylase (PgdA/CDA1 family)
MTEEVLQRVAGVSPVPYFRPPYGDYDESVNEDVGALGYAYNVMWSVDSRGFTGIPADEITRICLEGARPGAIIIMHVGAASQDGPALQGIIDGLRARGYEMGDVPAVLAP